MQVIVPCLCLMGEGKPKRHPDGEALNFRETLDFPTATKIRKSLEFIESDDPKARAIEVLAALTEAYILFGLEKWTVEDSRGKPVALTHGNIRSYLLANQVAADAAADAADDLYSKVVLLPLMAGAAKSSQPTRMASSTSAQTDSPLSRRKRSRRSMTGTTQTADTGAIS